MLKGIDVSAWQSTIDWAKVKNSGIQFAILRIGYATTIDKTFETNYLNAKKVNMPIGVYLYSYAKSVEGAKNEANAVIRWLKGKSLELPVYYDIEDKAQASLSKETRTKMCEAFCNTIEAAGFWAGIYSNKNWAENYVDGTKLGKRYTYWIAQYASKCTYKGNFDIWQHTSSGKVNGINGNVDMNIMYRDLISEIKASTKPSVDEIAKEVLAGKWGNGLERKQRLEAAGYSYSAVQARVEAMLVGK